MLFSLEALFPEPSAQERDALLEVFVLARDDESAPAALARRDSISVSLPVEVIFTR